MDPINTSPTNPYHISQAYGVSLPNGLRVRPMQAPTHAPAPGGLDLADTFQQTQGAHSEHNVARVVAARVPGAVDFSPELSRNNATPIPFYRHPADTNAAATAIDAGRVIDVNA